jgi:thiosulfate dehydrogenase [quinone] large subunit
MKNVEIKEAKLFEYFFSSTQFAWVWLVVRLYVGYQWFSAGWIKLFNPLWVGERAGTAVTGFLQGAIQKMGGAHPDVQSWYGMFIENLALPNAKFFSYLVTYGELLVGVALILGIFTGVAAFFGAFMNLNYLLAGTISINPELLFIEFFLITAWKNAGWYGMDRWILPKLGTPWQPGYWFDAACNCFKK